MNILAVPRYTETKCRKSQLAELAGFHLIMCVLDNVLYSESVASSFIPERGQNYVHSNQMTIVPRTPPLGVYLLYED